LQQLARRRCRGLVNTSDGKQSTAVTLAAGVELPAAGTSLPAAVPPSRASTSAATAAPAPPPAPPSRKGSGRHPRLRLRLCLRLLLLLRLPPPVGWRQRLQLRGVARRRQLVRLPRRLARV
jgi:hypothetical protein